MNDFDVIVIGSGAGGGAMAAALAAAGKRVVVLEKGPWLRDGDFRKDEIGASRRSMYSPDRREQPHVVETHDPEEGWQAYPTTDTGWDFWNGNLVGGASNLMSGFFHRKKPKDFRLLSEYGPINGGLLEFMLGHPNFIGNGVAAAFDGDRPVWGAELLERLQYRFGGARRVVVEAFADWLPTPEGRVTLDADVKDTFGLPVARVRIGKHPRNKQVADRLLKGGVEVLKRMGGRDIHQSSRGAPATNLPAGTCRMGNDPQSSVVGADCRVHDVENLYIADASVWPTGGSVPPTWTVYANALRVAHGIAGG